MEEFIFSAFLSSLIVAFGAGVYIGRSGVLNRLATEEARTRKWKERAYKMAWGIPLDDRDMRETRHACGVPKAEDYRKTPGGLRTSCK